MSAARTRRVVCLAAFAALATLAAWGIVWWINAGLELVAAPDRSLWRPGETVTGRIVLTNRWFEEATVRFREAPRLTLLDGNGQSVPRSRLDVAATSSRRSGSITVAPFSTHEIPFEIGTEPLALMGGHVVDAGDCTLAVVWSEMETDLESRAKPPAVRTRTTAVRFREPPGESQRDRIVKLAVAGERLHLLRWDGRVEALDLESGTQAAAARVGDHRAESDWPESLTFAPDGRSCVLLAESAESSLKLERFSLEAGAAAAPEPLVPIVEHASSASLRMLDFDAAGRVVRLFRKEAVAEVDLIAGGARISHASEFQGISPAGDHLALSSSSGGLFSVCRRTLHFVPLRRSAGSEPSTLCGRVGIYCGNEGKVGVHFTEYASGEARTLDAKAVVPLAESHDGGRVALSSTTLLRYAQSGRAGRLEVWDLNVGAQLFSLADGRQRSAAFTEQPPRLVCGLYRRGQGGATWFEPVFEVRDAATGALVKTLRAGR